MTETAFGSSFPPVSSRKPSYVDVEVFDGVRWVSLNDHYNFILGSETLAQTQQSLRNHTVSSSMYDGDFIVHTTKGNVTETVQVYVLGADHVHIGDNVNKLVEAFTQSTFLVRRTFGNDIEIWRCFPAEYAYKRGHIEIHNRRATLTFNVPRFPKVTREVME